MQTRNSFFIHPLTLWTIIVQMSIQGAQCISLPLLYSLFLLCRKIGSTFRHHFILFFDQLGSHAIVKLIFSFMVSSSKVLLLFSIDLMCTKLYALISISTQRSQKPVKLQLMFLSVKAVGVLWSLCLRVLRLAVCDICVTRRSFCRFVGHLSCPSFFSEWCCVCLSQGFYM